MDLKELRNQIDEIDDTLVNLFVKRMRISEQVADYKKAKAAHDSLCKNYKDTFITSTL